METGSARRLRLRSRPAPQRRSPLGDLHHCPPRTTPTWRPHPRATTTERHWFETSFRQPPPRSDGRTSRELIRPHVAAYLLLKVAVPPRSSFPRLAHHMTAVLPF